MTTRQMIGFVALCLLASLGWLTANVLPSTLAPTEGQGLRLLMVGVGGLLVFFARRSRLGLPPAGRCAALGFASLGVIGVPFLLLVFAAGRMPSTSGVLLFACMPILLCVVGASSSSADSGLRSLPYGLMGVAGILVLLPISMPHGSAGMIGFGALLLAVISTALCLVWLHRLLDGLPVLLAISLAGCFNGALLTAIAGLSGALQWDLDALRVQAVRCLLLDLPQVVLLLWLAKAVEPQRLSVQYLVTPLLTIVEGWLVLRPALDTRTIVGTVLLGAGAYFSLREEAGEHESALMLLGEPVSDDLHRSGGDGRS